jgi:transposase
MLDWKYSCKRPYKKDTVTSNKRVYLHMYYNLDKATEDKKAFDRRLMTMREELLNNKRKKENETAYRKYFIIKETLVKGINVTVNEEAVRKAKRYYGYFTLLSNEKMDSITAIELYRNKDTVEKAFNNIKERLNLRRTLVSSEQSLNGKLFVAYIGLIYLSYIKKHMQRAGLFELYTMHSMLDKLDVIECFEYPGYALKVGEVTEAQKQIYQKLGVNTPT